MPTTECTKSDSNVPTTNPSKRTNRCYLYGRLIIATLPSLTSGMMLNWPSPVLVKLQSLGDQNPLGHVISTTDTAIIGSALAFGAIIGPYIAAYLPQKIGRRYTLISLAITFIIGLLTLAFAKHVYLYYAARLFIGFAYGSVYTLLPVYVVEFAGNFNRGTVINISGVFTMAGSVLSLSIGAYTSIMTFCLISAAIPTIFIILFMTLMPESPYDLLLLGKEELAKKSFFSMNLGTDRDFENIKKSTNTKVKTPYSEIFKVKSNIKAIAITFGLVTFMQCSGATVVTPYIQNIFEAAGDDFPSEISPIIVGFVAFLFTFIVPYFVEKRGRTFLLKISSAGMSTFFAFAGVYFYLVERQDVSNLFWIPIIGLVGIKVSYAVGFLSVVWILMAELMPYNVKAAAAALTNSFCWTMLFAITFAFPIITDNVGLAVSFWIFSVFNFVALIFVVVAVPETKGKNAQEIQEMLS